MDYSQLVLSAQSPLKPKNQFKSENPWWVKITTSQPKCVYYFGSFDSKTEAINALPGYVEDLENEQAKRILIEIKQDNPKQLTIAEA
jgi:Domain of unknown function (DUF1816)